MSKFEFFEYLHLCCEKKKFVTEIENILEFVFVKSVVSPFLFDTDLHRPLSFITKNGGFYRYFP